MKKYLSIIVPIAVLLVSTACSSSSDNQSVSGNNKRSDSQAEDVHKMLANEHYKVTVTGGDVVATTKNPLIEHISIRSAELNKLASSKTPFETLGYKMEVLKNAQGKNDGVLITMTDGAGSKYGFKDRDVIIGIDRVPVTSVAAVNKIFSTVSREGTVSVTIKRKHVPHKIILIKAEKK